MKIEMKLEIYLDEKNERLAVLHCTDDELQALVRLTKIGIAHSDGSKLSSNECRAESEVYRLLQKVKNLFG